MVAVATRQPARLRGAVVVISAVESDELRMASLERLLQTIDLIHEAALDAAGWSAALEQIAELLAAQETTVAYQSAGSVFPSWHAVRCDPALHQDYAEHFQKIDPILAFVRRAPPGVYTDEMVMPKSELRRHEISADFGRRSGTDSVMQAFAFDDPQSAGLFAVGRSRRAGPFSKADIRIVGHLLPHLRQAMRTQLRLGSAVAEARSAYDALDRLALPAIMVDRERRIVFANRSAEGLLAQADGLLADAGGLRAATPTATAALHRLLRDAICRSPTGTRSGSLRIDRASGNGPLVVTVSPVGSRETDWLPQPRPAAIVFATGLPAQPGPSVPMLRSLFGLTPAEAQVAEAVAAGRGTKEAARVLGIAPTTARWHLQRVFEKTGVSRQAELAQLVAGFAAVSSAAR